MSRKLDDYLQLSDATGVAGVIALAVLFSVSGMVAPPPRNLGVVCGISSLRIEALLPV